MKSILFAASEALPFASTGGLGDVAGSLPAALAKLGCDARVVIPLYSSIDEKYRREMHFICAIRVRLSWRNQYCGVFSLVKDGVTYYFLDNEFYFKRVSMYGNYDDGERFAFFCKAILDMMPYIDFFPDILHTNDWHTALAAIYLKRKYGQIERYSEIRSVHTIHNIEYQGVYDFSILDDVFDLPPSNASIVDYNGLVNLTKGAIVCCDRLTTVSPRYAEEIMTETFASGLHYILGENSYKIVGILNGIDVDYYNPATDPAIPAHYTSDDLSGKATCKAELQRRYGLPVEPDKPMIAMISRLASHKGMNLVERVLDELLQQDVQFVVLGKGEIQYERFFRGIEERYNNKARAIIEYNKELSKLVYAASDIFLMPSRTEPCGLSQMIASRYGSIPLVRETGGLYDSIKNYNPSDRSGNGFTFKNYNAHEMLFALKDAVKFMTESHEEWEALVRHVMNVDFSWDLSAERYIDMYSEII